MAECSQSPEARGLTAAIQAGKKIYIRRGKKSDGLAKQKTEKAGFSGRCQGWVVLDAEGINRKVTERHRH
jgi:hypothetical protein